MATVKKLNILAREILDTNQYMSLGTVMADGTPWVAPVVYANDRENNLYYMSLPLSRHSQNIMAKPKVSVAIFDSHQKYGQGVGLQMEGKVEKLALTKSTQAFKCYFGRKWPFGELKDSLALKKFFRDFGYRFYRFKPTKVWMNDPRQKTDKRVEVIV